MNVTRGSSERKPHNEHISRVSVVRLEVDGDGAVVLVSRLRCENGQCDSCFP